MADRHKLDVQVDPRMTEYSGQAPRLICGESRRTFLGDLITKIVL